MNYNVVYNKQVHIGAEMSISVGIFAVSMWNQMFIILTDDRVYSFDQLCECKTHNNRWNSSEDVHLVFSHLIHLLCVQLIYFASNNVCNQLIIVQHAEYCLYDIFKCNVVYMTLQFTSIFCWVCIIPIIIIFGVTLSCILSFYVWLFLFMLQSRRMKKSVYNEKNN